MPDCMTSNPLHSFSCRALFSPRNIPENVCAKKGGGGIQALALKEGSGCCYLGAGHYNKLSSGTRDPFFPINSPFARETSLRILKYKQHTVQPNVTCSDDVNDSRESTDQPLFRIVASIQSEHSQIAILDVPKETQHSLAGGRLLLLDQSGNLASILFRDRQWTDSYWDEFASLPPLLPSGPIGILGLAAGTVARIILRAWPAAHLEGWEIDKVVVDMARYHMGLEELELPNSEGGHLVVHVGDALGEDARTQTGFAGLVVDLFSGGQVLPQLQKVETWQILKGRLREGGRIMVNCGGPSEDGGIGDAGLAATMSTLQAIAAAFPDEISFRVTSGSEANYLALTGLLPNCEDWATSLPEHLRESAHKWSPYDSRTSVHS